MEFKYTFNEQDFIFYQLVTLDNLKHKVKIAQTFQAFLIVLFLFISFLGFNNYGFTKFIISWVTLALVVGVLFFISSGNKLLLKRYQNVSYLEMENQTMLINIDEEVILLRDFEDYEYYLVLNKINKLVKTTDYLVIFTKKDNLILPLRIFNNTEYLNIIEFIRSKTKDLQIIEKEYK